MYKHRSVDNYHTAPLSPAFYPKLINTIEKNGNFVLRTSSARRRRKRLKVEESDILDYKTFQTIMNRSPTSRYHTLFAAQNAIGPPVVGDKKILVIPVDFSDKVAKTGVEKINDIYFSHGKDRSVAAYYREVSYGALNIIGETISGSSNKGWFRAPKKLKEYASDNAGVSEISDDGTILNSQTLVSDLIELVRKEKLDLSDYDIDGNGVIDYLCVVHAGKGFEQTGKNSDLHSCQWYLNDPVVIDEKNKILVQHFCLVPELGNIGVYCHELGHAFGLPDLYDYTFKSKGAGLWCLMAWGMWNDKQRSPAHLSVWCKIKLGWIKPEVIIDNKIYDISSIELNNRGSAYRLWTSGKEQSEYYLIENRRKEGFDSYLPNEGLLVWHIDDTIGDNNHMPYYHVGLIQADGRGDLEYDVNYGDEGDPFPGASDNRTFNDRTVPSSRSYNNKNSKVVIMDISNPDKIMKAKISVKG